MLSAFGTGSTPSITVKARDGHEQMYLKTGKNTFPDRELIASVP